MAIKGKGRTRSRRPIAAPPRPQLVVRKKPIWRRRGALALVGGLLLAGVLLAVLLSIRSSSKEDRKNRTIAAVQQFDGTMAASLPPGSQPLGGDLILFPTISQDLDRIAQGKLTGKKATQLAEGIRKAAAASAEEINAIRVTKVVPEDAETSVTKAVTGLGATRLELLDAQFMMVRGLRIYEDIAALMKTAAGLEKPGRRALMEQAKEMAVQATEVFGRGYRKVSNVKTVLGIQQPLGLQPTLPPSG